ncbi:MAG: hypothetical protein FJ077_00960 [Cyanobacteria bacterium K_DeepCast_35m_m2_023]|nr:hypothetical protein [Cyanobacteria bacterium K_DeepCast_35m_m2_023]
MAAFSLLPLSWSAAIAAPAAGRCAPPADLTRLSGVWQATALAHVSGGVADSVQRLQLQVGADGRVRGQRDWAARDTTPGAIQGRDRQGQPAFREVEPLIGWIEPRRCRLLLVETDDSGRVSGWLRRDAAGPFLELEISQSGRGAVVVFADFRRPTSTQAGATPKP